MSSPGELETIVRRILALDQKCKEGEFEDEVAVPRRLTRLGDARDAESSTLLGKCSPARRGRR